MEASRWERLTEGETGSSSDEQGHAQEIFNPIFCWWVELCFLPAIYLGPNYGGGNEDNGDLLQKVPCMYGYTQSPQPCGRLLTHASAGDSWTLTGKWTPISNLSYILYSSIVNNLIICQELAFPHASLSFFVWFLPSETSPQLWPR